MPTHDNRQAYKERLREKGVYTVFHSLPLHLSEMGTRLGGRPGDCPITESVSDRLVRLPFYTNLTREEQDYAIETIYEFAY